MHDLSTAEIVCIYGPATNTTYLPYLTLPYLTKNHEDASSSLAIFANPPTQCIVLSLAGNESPRTLLKPSLIKVGLILPSTG